MNEGAPSPACDRNGVSTNGKPTAGEILEVANGVYTRAETAALSPSLWQNREEPAFELKFQLSLKQAQEVAAWANEHLHLDPHARPELGNAYHVHGLYFDTSNLDVFHRSQGYKRKKYRLRRYGENPLIFLEQKRKSQGRVAKRRVEVTETELPRLREAPVETEWLGAWFHRRINMRKLEPSCLISYERQAFFGHNAEGPLRLTLDCNVRGQNADGWTVGTAANGLPMTVDRVLLELKYRKHLPALFKGLMQDLALTPAPLSKYRLAIQALGRGTIPQGAG